jgi:hypothetical protein
LIALIKGHIRAQQPIRHDLRLNRDDSAVFANESRQRNRVRAEIRPDVHDCVSRPHKASPEAHFGLGELAVDGQAVPDIAVPLGTRKSP